MKKRTKRKKWKLRVIIGCQANRCHRKWNVTLKAASPKKIGTFCKTKIAIFVKARGRGAKKWRMFGNIHTKVRVDSLLREQIFRFEIGLSWGESSGSAGSERWFGWFIPFNWICQHFFPIEIWTSVMFSWSTFGLWWVACRMAFWTWCSSRRPSIQFELAMDFILCLRVGRAAHQLFSSSMSPSSWESSRRREKCENLPRPPKKKPPQRADPKQCKLRGEVARQTGQNFTHHLPPLPWSTVRSNRNFSFLFAKRRDGSPDRHNFRVSSNPVSRKLAYEFRFAKPP